MNKLFLLLSRLQFWVNYKPGQFRIELTYDQFKTVSQLLTKYEASNNNKGFGWATNFGHQMKKSLPGLTGTPKIPMIVDHNFINHLNDLITFEFNYYDIRTPEAIELLLSIKDELLNSLIKLYTNESPKPADTAGEPPRAYQGSFGVN